MNTRKLEIIFSFALLTATGKYPTAQITIVFSFFFSSMMTFFQQEWKSLHILIIEMDCRAHFNNNNFKFIKGKNFIRQLQHKRSSAHHHIIHSHTNHTLSNQSHASFESTETSLLNDNHHQYHHQQYIYHHHHQQQQDIHSNNFFQQLTSITYSISTRTILYHFISIMKNITQEIKLTSRIELIVMYDTQNNYK